MQQIISDTSLMVILTALNELQERSYTPSLKARIDRALAEVEVYSNKFGYPREGV